MKRIIHFLWGFLFIIVSFTPCFSQNDYEFQSHIGYKRAVKWISAMDVDSAGNVYILTESDRCIHKISSKGVYISRFTLPPMDYSNVTNPDGIGVDSKGNIYVAGWGNDHVMKFDSTGKLIFKFGARGSSNGYFNSPVGIAFDKKGSIYIADTYNHRIQKFDTNGKFLMKFGSYGTADGQLNIPMDICLDKNGNIYVADGQNFRIQKFDSTGKFITKYGTHGTGNGQFRFVFNNSIDKIGNIYGLDYYNNRFQKFDSTGNFIRTYMMAGRDSLQNPIGLCVDVEDNIYVGERDKRAIHKLDPQGNVIWTFESNPLKDGAFYEPQGIASDRFGNIYVVDTGNNRVQKFDSKGRFLLKFNQTSDGKLSSPTSVCTDRWNNVYVSDYSKVFRFDSLGNCLSSLTLPEYYASVARLAADTKGNVCVYLYGTLYTFSPKGDLLRKISITFPPDKTGGESSGLAVNSYGYIYISENTGVIYEFTPEGKFYKKIGNQLPTLNTYPSVPPLIGIDSEDNIYLALQQGHIVRKYDLTGKVVSTFGGVGGNEDGNLNTPTGVIVTPEGLVYVTERGNNRVSVFRPKNYRSYTNIIRGTIFSDDNQNCILDANEKTLAGIAVVAQPGNRYAMTNTAGVYQIQADTGTYTVSQLVQTTEKALIQPICPASNTSSAITFKGTNEIVQTIDFADKVVLLRLLATSVSSNRRRRCFLNTTTVTYSNTGYADAENVKVYVKMPRYVVLKSANKPYVLDKDSNYVFTIGTLKAGVSGKIQIIDSVVCQRGITGLTACTKAWITPANPVAPKPTWDQSDITLSGRCIENGRVRFVLTNSGQGSMADSSEFRLLVDAQLALRKNLKLAKGDSLVLRVPANGKTVRLEVNQRPDHPRKSQSNLTLEGCVASASEVVSKGFVDVLPQDDAEPEVAIDCQQIIDSFDPNDKLVSPIGTTNQHYTPTTAELKYLIRFQNTGSDTAYTVTVIDTLDAKLDISTLNVQGSSHAYTMRVSGKNQPVLTWIFNNINLPDSTRDQAGSNGFIQFSIKPKEGLAEKTRIENFADIIFDYNDPIRTNTTFNVIYDIPPVVDNTVRLDENKVIPLPPTIRSFAPESVAEGMQVILTGTNYEPGFSYTKVLINGLAATIVSTSETQLTVVVPQGVKPGKITVTTDGGVATSQKNLLLRPLISSFSPASVLEGESLTIKGKYYELLPADNTVQINGIAATILSATETQLVVRVPQGAKPGKLTVTTPGGTVLSEQVLLFRPTISSFTPTTGQPDAEMTITGTHYELLPKDNSVTINGITATVLSASETQLVVAIPAGVTTGKVSVTTPGGTAVSEVEFVATPLATEPVWSRPIRVYPNPADDKLMIDFSATAVSVYRVEVVNMLGQQIVGQTLSKGVQMEELNLSSVGVGMYWLVLKTSEGTAVRKIQVK